MFCVECGTEEDVHDGLCKACLVRKGKFITVPEVIDVLVCTHCNAMQIGSRWEPVDDIVQRAARDAILSEREVQVNAVEMDVTEEDGYNFKVQMTVDVSTRGFDFPLQADTRVRIKMGSCNNCSRKRGSYFEAVVQIRARRRDPGPEEVDEAMRMAEELVGASGSFITKVEEVKGGTDIYLGRSSDGRALSQQLSSMFGAQTQETKSQAGRKDGTDVYRSTFLVRLPSFKRGDFALLDGSVWEVRAFTKSKVNLEEVRGEGKRSLPMKEVEDLPIFGREGHLKKAVVVSDHGPEIQVMDPESYRTKDMRKPLHYKDGSKEIAVVLYDGELYPYLLE